MKNAAKSCKSSQASLQFALERERRRLVNCQERERTETENELKQAEAKFQDFKSLLFDAAEKVHIIE